MATEFLFDSFDSKPARNPRKQHLKTVYDLMHLSILRRDFERAKRAWSILIRCPEFDANEHWRVGLGMILGWKNVEDNDRQQQLEFLKAMMLREERNKEEVLVEIILLLIKAKRHLEALDELDLKVPYLPGAPYQDSPVLHTYAGALSLYFAQSPSGRDEVFTVPANDQAISLDGLDQAGLRKAQNHFLRACELDPRNVEANHFLNLLQEDGKSTVQEDDDQESVVAAEVLGNATPPPRKRLKGG